jgi:hypothetical protein
MYRKSKKAKHGIRRTTRNNPRGVPGGRVDGRDNNVSSIFASAEIAAATAGDLSTLPDDAGWERNPWFGEDGPTSTSTSMGTTTATARRKKNGKKKDMIVRRWVLVSRPPAHGIGFKVPTWVTIENLTVAERLRYETEQARIRESKSSIHGDGATELSSVNVTSNMSEGILPATTEDTSARLPLLSLKTERQTSISEKDEARSTSDKKAQAAAPIDITMTEATLVSDTIRPNHILGVDNGAAPPVTLEVLDSRNSLLAGQSSTSDPISIEITTRVGIFPDDTITHTESETVEQASVVDHASAATLAAGPTMIDHNMSETPPLKRIRLDENEIDERSQATTNDPSANEMVMDTRNE